MTTDIWSESLINELTDEDIESFHEIVLRDVKNKDNTSDDKSILFNNLDLWLYCLRITRREIELQLAQHRTNIRAKINESRISSSDIGLEEMQIAEEKWRNNAMKFLNAVEKKTLYVKLLVEEEKQIDE